jgi:ABC-type bacteriocin/lantibiotic exporter with double-glycine peptidase domain
MQNGNRQFKLPFYRQETPDSCVPACLRMVLAGLGVDRAEAVLRQMCDCTMLGTDALNVVDAARQLGFPLARQLEKGLFDAAWGMTNRLTILIPGQGIATD